MIKYKLELKPVKKFGIESLSDDKKNVLNITLTFMSQMLMLQDSIVSVQVQDDLSLLIEAKEEVADELERLHAQAILTKLPN